MLTAKDIMTREVLTANPDARLIEIIKTLVDNKVSGMPVCDSSRLSSA